MVASDQTVPSAESDESSGRSFAVGLVSVTVDPEERSYTGTPISAGTSGAEVTGTVRVAELSTPDGLRMTVGLMTWPDGSRDVQPLDFLAGPDPYRRLERAGRMSFADLGDGSACALLRAFKFGGREWPTLASVDWSDLDELAGADAAALLVKHGAVRTDAYGEIRPAAKKYREHPAMEVSAGSVDSIFAAFALTRVLPIMLGFGLAGGVDMAHA